MGIEIEGLTLGNVGDGELESQFQDMVAKVVETFEEPELYEHSGGAMKCSIVMEAVFTRHAETGVVHVGVRAGFKSAKRREALRAAWVREGGVLVEKAVQASMFDAKNVTPIRSEEESEA